MADYELNSGIRVPTLGRTHNKIVKEGFFHRQDAKCAKKFQVGSR